MADDEVNTVYVGDKDLGNYLGAVTKQLSENEAVKLMARGQENNGKAIDVAEISRRDEEDIAVSDISISTEEFENDDGEEHRVSSVEIKLVNE